MSKSITELVKESYENAKDKGWHDPATEKTVGDDIALMHSELSEALEDFRAGKGVADIYYEGSKPCGIPIELADVLIRIFDFSGKYNIDLDLAVEKKMAYNATRPHRHGNKKL